MQTSAVPSSVYYFGTCLIDMAYPQTGLAGIKLLQRAGFQVIYPQEQSCCGQPAYNAGFPLEAREVARKQLRLFDKDYPVVVPSGSCAGMMKYHYRELFRDQPEFPQVERLAARIHELSAFLVRVAHVQLKDRGAPIRVTWHSSCHAAREMGVIADSKALLGQLKNVELVELTRERECCGFGGTFAVKQPAISAAMVRDKVDDIVQTGAVRVLTGDCGCLMNIAGAMQYQGLSVRGQHLAEFIWERTNG